MEAALAAGYVNHFDICTIGDRGRGGWRVQFLNRSLASDNVLDRTKPETVAFEPQKGLALSY